VLCEPDSREPWFVSAAHDDACLAHTLRAFEAGVDRTLELLRPSREPTAKEA
jgi:glutamate-1-semialdehyde 2,1-aminomutase